MTPRTHVDSIFDFSEVGNLCWNIVQFANRARLGAKKGGMDRGKKNVMRTIVGCDLAEGGRYLSARDVQSWGSFCSDFLLRAERFKESVYFQRRELAGFSRKSNIFNGIFLCFFAPRSRENKKKKEDKRGITSVPCDRSFVATSLVACFRLPNNLFFVHDARDLVISTRFFRWNNFLCSYSVCFKTL